jgi:hypothetical protein
MTSGSTSARPSLMKKGDGFNVVLQALPLHGNGKLVMRAYEPEARAAKAGDGERPKPKV